MKAFNTSSINVIIGVIIGDVAHWAQTYRGYEYEDLFFENLVLLLEKLTDYFNLKNMDEVDSFAQGVYKIIDDAFPDKSK